jgi:2',3'-cyclic-nucleotide 2'-phosphodiesterase (5'-nucleotidase family)
VDLGNYFMPLGPGSEEVNHLMLESFEALPLQVVNLAPADLFFWQGLSQAQFSSSRVISTNLTPKNNELRAPARYAVVHVPASAIGLKADLKVGFLGLSDPAQVKPNSGFVGVDPLEAVAKVKPEVMKQAKFLVVLADLPKSTATQLAQAHSEVYAVLLTEKMFAQHPAEQVNNAVLLWSVMQGRYLGQLVLEVDETGNVVVVKPNSIELNGKVAEDPALLRRQNEVKAKVPASGH